MPATPAPAAVIVRLPRTPAGRALLRDAVRTIRSADTRVYVANLFDWDESAIMDAEFERNYQREAQ